ncbi:MAG: hypothetical protein U0835_03750 [Isosphaeraceae bacterium]
MRRLSLVMLAAVLACSAAAFRAALAADDKDEPKAIAVKALTAGAALFEAKNAKGIAETYTEDAVLTVVTRENDTRKIKKEVRHGRADIEAYYVELFKSESPLHSKNTVEFARWAGPDAVIISGYFEPDTTSADSLKLPFVQTRVKEGDSWKITEIQVFFLPAG